MQKRHIFVGSDYLSDVPEQLNDTLESIATDFSGSSFPAENIFVGMKCFRTDESKIYRLHENASNQLVWQLEYTIIDGGIKVEQAINDANDKAITSYVAKVEVGSAQGKIKVTDGAGNETEFDSYTIATQSEAETGANNTKGMTPLQTKNAIKYNNATNRLPNATYKVDDVVYHKSNLSVALKCVTAGTTSNTELNISTKAVGESVEDGSVIWLTVARNNVDAFAPIRCSEAGMTSNDNDGKNFAILKSLVNNGSKILVDDFYTIKEVSKIDVTRDLYIHGADKGFGFNFLVGEELFILHEGCNNVELSNLRLVGQERIFLLKADGKNTNENIKLDKLIFTDNICEEHIRAAQLTGSLTSFPSLASYGIQEVELSRNVCKNIHHHFFIFHNLPVGHCSCIANKVTNFNHYFLGAMVDNEHSYVDLMKVELGSFEIAYNVVKNTDDWWVPDVADLYLCFAIIEANEVYYHHNHVEGLKCDHSLKTTDVILYSNHIVSRNNVWKNNLCFDSSYYGGEVFSSKSGGVKYYEDNHYTVEKDWLERIGKTVDDYNIRLIEVVEASEWHIRRNIIIMPKLNLVGTGLLYKEFEFCDNIVRLDSGVGCFLVNSRLSTYENPAVAVMRGNEIEILGGDINSFYYNGDSNGAYTGQRVYIENNTIRVNSNRLYIIRNDNHTSITDFLKFDNNVIINDGERTVLCANAVAINTLFGDNKLISGKDDTLRFPLVKKECRYKHTYSFETLSQVTSPFITFTDDYPTFTKLTYDISEGIDKSWSIELSFELFEEDGVKKIKYKNGASDATVKLLHPTSSECIALKIGDCPISFTLHLSSSGTSDLRASISRTIQAGEIVETLMTR